MYFPIGWPRQLQGPCMTGGATRLVHVCSNRDRLLFCALTEDGIGLWFCKPAVQIVFLRRHSESLEEHGHHVFAEWKPDSSMLAITTTRGYILFYKVEVDTSVPNAALFNQREERRTGNRRDSMTIGEGDTIPALLLVEAGSIQIAGGAKSLVCLREELMVATGTGLLQRVRWDGFAVAEMTVHMTEIPFSIDLQHSRASQLTECDVYTKCLSYSPLMGGFATVLSDGRAAFITANSLKFEPNQVVSVWAQEVNQATCAAVNHKYMLMAFGCKNGEGIVYHLDELTGALLISHRLVVSSKNLPDASNICGGVHAMRWTPDGCALALAWEKGGLSLWSVFGALLLCSIGQESSLPDDLTDHPPLHINSMEWGSEGYHLWMVADPHLPVAEQSCTTRQPELLQMHFVKSSLTVNPCSPSHSHLFLQGEDKLYLSTEDSIPLWTASSEPGAADLAMMSAKQWQIVPIPHSYLAYNWPIRYSAVNAGGHCVAVAGKTGLAHYALFTRRWKLFGNETQERDMVVTGGLTWWKDFICTACYNLMDQRDEIRFYPRDCKLDNTFGHVVRVPSQILLLNTFHNILIVLCADCHIMIFRLERITTQNTPTIQATKLQEVAIGNFIPHPATVVNLTLTSLRTETTSKVQTSHNEHESILLNVGGRLLMFQRDRTGPQAQVRKDNKERPLPFCAPVMVASCVELMWSSAHRNPKKPHLTEALWLGCGAAGMKVWLPLHPKDEGKSMGFLSRRIMLPFRVDVYPLAVLFEGGIIMGATTDSLMFPSTAQRKHSTPYMQLERASQVYLHHVLRQLLRRNLGVHALEIARSCKDLSYFPHVLELLLHEVLEEEATSKEPIPDPLLPRIVAFIQEFPEFLQTVVHCARKTEVALWQYLFATVGNPKELFEECLMNKTLETAASYLIILQNMEKPLVSRQHATLLLDAALEERNWQLARDLVRFLKAIDPNEADSPHATTRSRVTSNPLFPSSMDNTPPMSPTDASNTPYAFSASLRDRSLSMNKDKGKEKPKEKPKLSRTESNNSRKRTVSGSKDKDDTSAEQFFIDVILHRHARKLLSSYHLRDLASFAANLEDYPLVTWLRKERLRAARVEDFVAALKKLHSDFHWPLPIVTLHSLRKMTSVVFAQSIEARRQVENEDVVGAAPTGDAPTTLTSMSSTATSLLDCEVNGLSTTSNGPLTSGASSTSTAVDSTTFSQLSASEVYLQPQSSVDEVSHTNTEVSDTSSALGEMELSDNSGSSDTLCLSALEQLTQELANKGPPQSELELRFLLQMMLEAGCLEWALLISIILRDGMAVVRTVNTASLTDTPLEVVGRMREGLSFLELWADTECFGYKPFFQLILGQSQQLAKVIESAPPSLRIPSASKRISTSSNDSESEPSVGSPHTPLPQELLGREVEEGSEAGAEDGHGDERYEGCSVS